MKKNLKIFSFRQKVFLEKITPKKELLNYGEY